MNTRKVGHLNYGKYSLPLFQPFLSLVRVLWNSTCISGRVWGEVERLMLMDVVLLFAVDCESESPDAVYLPAELKVLNGPEYFRLQRTDRYMPGNASLSSRSETFLFLHRRLSGKPTIQAGYPPFTAQQVNSHMQLCKGTPFPFLIPAVRCFSRAQDFLSSPGNTS